MPTVDVLAALAATSGVISAGRLALDRIREKRDRRVVEVLTANEGIAESPKQPRDELWQLHDQLFSQLGQLSLHEFAGDHKARSLVERAIDRAQSTVNTPGVSERA